MLQVFIYDFGLYPDHILTKKSLHFLIGKISQR
jgi:hypothetical protein